MPLELDSIVTPKLRRPDLRPDVLRWRLLCSRIRQLFSLALHSLQLRFGSRIDLPMSPPSCLKLILDSEWVLVGT